MTASADVRGELRDTRLRRLYDYWSTCRGQRRWPARRDIDPLEFRYVLGNVMLLDVLADPLRFRVRLHGDNMARRAGYDLTGKLLDELPITDYRTYVTERCKALIDTGEPTVVRRDRVLDNRTRRYEALWLPFSDDGRRITMLLCALIYDEP